MKVDELKKYIKRIYKGKISITYGMIIALILGAGIYEEVNAAYVADNEDFVEFTVTNKETISRMDVSSYADNDSDYFEITANNYGNIMNSGDYGMYITPSSYYGRYVTSNSMVINEIEGTITNGGNYRMYAKVGEAINRGTLDTGFNGKSFEDGYRVMGGTVFTDYSGTVHTDITGTIINEGTIEVNHNYGVAMYVDSGATAVNEGTINLNRKNGIGMYATGTGSTIENRGKIYLSGSVDTASKNNQTDWETAPAINGMDSKGNIGMKIENGATMINKGQIVFGKTKKVK